MAETEPTPSSTSETETQKTDESSKAPAEPSLAADKKSEVTEDGASETKEPVAESSEAEGSASEKDVKDAEKWLSQGKRNLVCGEVTLAVQQLQEACRLLAEKHGETADECGEAYLCYGTALLELSRMESGVLGNALQGIDEDESQDEDEKSEEKSEASEQFEDPSKLTDEEGGTEEEGEEEEEEEGESVDDEAGTSQDEGESTEDKTEEDVSNLQLSWEVLELAKVIFGRLETKEGKLKLAEAMLKLGEVGLETESYEQAIKDFESCLKVQIEMLEKDDRKIAETYYQLGLAENFSGKHDCAIGNFKKASEVIEARMASLTKVLEESEKAGKGKESANSDDPVVAAQKEINDLKELLPDMINKIKDTEEEKANEEKVKQMVKENVASELGATTTGFGSPTKQTPAQDISHLIRKKRKPEEEAVPESGDAEAKKPRQDPEKSEVDGSGDAKVTNGQSNGKEPSPEKKTEDTAKSEDIKVKTVEDVKKLADEPMETEAQNAS